MIMHYTNAAQRGGSGGRGKQNCNKADHHSRYWAAMPGAAYVLWDALIFPSKGAFIQKETLELTVI